MLRSEGIHRFPEQFQPIRHPEIHIPWKPPAGVLEHGKTEVTGNGCGSRSTGDHFMDPQRRGPFFPIQVHEKMPPPCPAAETPGTCVLGFKEAGSIDRAQDLPGRRIQPVVTPQETGIMKNHRSTGGTWVGHELFLHVQLLDQGAGVHDGNGRKEPGAEIFQCVVTVRTMDQDLLHSGLTDPLAMVPGLLQKQVFLSQNPGRFPAAGHGFRGKRKGHLCLVEQ